MDVYIGIDVGSVSTNVVVMDEHDTVIDTLYVRTNGRPIEAVQNCLATTRQRQSGINVIGIGTTGSGRHLAGAMVGADVIKNEITAHAVAAMHIVSDVQTVIEIGGQDSKIIIIHGGTVVDFAMNTLCAAGTGSFLDQQAARLNLSIEQFSRLAVESDNPVRIAGRCAVFAESDMIHKQQTGHAIPDILSGLCQALARNYLNNVGKGKQIRPPVLFQGGVAANQGMRLAFERELKCQVIVPPYFDVMGAVGAALLAKEHCQANRTAFLGFDILKNRYVSRSFECTGCSNLCEIIEIEVNGRTTTRWGDRCGKWSSGSRRDAGCLYG